jgi:hypothetical protein
MDNVKNTDAAQRWKQAGEELANSLKSYLQIQTRCFRVLESAKINKPEIEYMVLLFI